MTQAEPIETTTPMGRAFLGILAVLAQLEREQTSQRVADALAFKRNQGKLLGTLQISPGSCASSASMAARSRWWSSFPKWPPR